MRRLTLILFLCLQMAGVISLVLSRSMDLNSLTPVLWLGAVVLLFPANLILIRALGSLPVSWHLETTLLAILIVPANALIWLAVVKLYRRVRRGLLPRSDRPA